VIEEATEGQNMASSTKRLVAIAQASKIETASWGVVSTILCAIFALVMGDAFLSARTKALVPMISIVESGNGTGFDFGGIAAAAGNGTAIDETSWPFEQWTVIIDSIPTFNIALHLLVIAFGMYIQGKVLHHRPKPTRDSDYALALPVNMNRLIAYLRKYHAHETVSRDASLRNWGDYIANAVATRDADAHKMEEEARNSTKKVKRAMARQKTKSLIEVEETVELNNGEDPNPRP
jgi:hypothetical protein